MHIEPAQNQRLAERVRVRLLEGGLKNFLPTTKAEQACLRHFATEQDRRIAFILWEIGKSAAVLVAARIMDQQILDGLNLEPLQRRQFRPRDPLQLAEGLRELDHSMGAAARNAST